jgi:intracellular septation protein
MSDANKPEPATDGPAIDSLKLAIEFGPLVVFALANFGAKRLVGEDQAVYWATGLFMAATALAMVASKIRTGKIPLMLWITGIVVTIFGVLTIALHDKRFIQIKPTVVNFFFAAVLLIGVALRKNFLKMVMGEAFPELPDSVWRTLTVRWSMLFIALAILNEFIWRNYSFDTWVASKFIPFVVSMVFMVAHMPLILKHVPEQKVPDKKV